MNFDELLKQRRSIRDYSPKKVSFENITKICEASRFSPMAGNIYTIRLVIINNERKIKDIAEMCFEQNFVGKASCLIVVCSDLSSVVRSYDERGKIYARQQAGAAIENMLLKTAELKLATCWIGAFDEDAVKRILKIPENIQIEAILPIAYASKKTIEKKKPDLKMIAFFEQWKQREQKPIKKVDA